MRETTMEQIEVGQLIRWQDFKNRITVRVEQVAHDLSEGKSIIIFFGTRHRADGSELSGAAWGGGQRTFSGRRDTVVEVLQEKI